MTASLRLAAALATLFAFAGTAHAEAACGIGAPGTTQRVTVGATGRAMLVHWPKDFRSGKAAPLVFVLHGSGGTGANILRSSKLGDTADRHGFIVAAPDAGIPVDKGFVWNIPGVPTITGKVPNAQDADDVAFLGAAIDWLAARHCVDAERVYSTGLSGGGRMTSWLGCVASGRFAAIAPVVGLRAGNPLAGEPTTPDPATCRPTHPMPVIAFAGDRDRTNPIEGGGAGYWQYTMRAAELRWATLNGCAAVLPRRDVSSDVYEDVATKCRAGADVVGRIHRGRGHEWVADNEAMWAFFARHRRR